MINNKTEPRLGVIFDLDGTLWNSTAQVKIAWNDVFRRRGVPFELTSENMKVMMGKTISEIGEALLGDMPVEERAPLLRECCAEENSRLCRYGGKLFPNAFEVLEMLSSTYHVSIVSNCEKGYIESFLEYHKTARFISDRECIGNTGLDKGQNIKLVMERNGLLSAIYVGDTKRDMLSAEYAGIPFIRAGYGFGGEFVSANSINDLGELPALVMHLFAEVK